jgi:hypothetical protein
MARECRFRSPECANPARRGYAQSVLTLAKFRLLDTSSYYYKSVTSMYQSRLIQILAHVLIHCTCSRRSGLVTGWCQVGVELRCPPCLDEAPIKVRTCSPGRVRTSCRTSGGGGYELPTPEIASVTAFEAAVLVRSASSPPLS